MCNVASPRCLILCEHATTFKIRKPKNHEFRSRVVVFSESRIPHSARHYAPAPILWNDHGQRTSDPPSGLLEINVKFQCIYETRTFERFCSKTRETYALFPRTDDRRQIGLKYPSVCACARVRAPGDAQRPFQTVPTPQQPQYYHWNLSNQRRRPIEWMLLFWALFKRCPLTRGA